MVEAWLSRLSWLLGFQSASAVIVLASMGFLQKIDYDDQLKPRMIVTLLVAGLSTLAPCIVYLLIRIRLPTSVST